MLHTHSERASLARFRTAITSWTRPILGDECLVRFQKSRLLRRHILSNDMFTEASACECGSDWFNRLNKNDCTRGFKKASSVKKSGNAKPSSVSTQHTVLASWQLGRWSKPVSKTG